MGTGKSTAMNIAAVHFTKQKKVHFKSGVNAGKGLTSEFTSLLVRRDYMPGKDLYLADVPGGDDPQLIKEAAQAVLQLLNEGTEMHVNVGFPFETYL